MNRSTYILKNAEIQSRVANLKQKLKDLQQEYISSNQPFPIGSKVCLLIPAKEGDEESENKRYAYVIGYKIVSDKVVPRMKMANEDGSISHIDEYGPFRNEVIELAND